MFDKLRIALARRFENTSTRSESLEEGHTDTGPLYAEGKSLIGKGNYAEAEKVYRKVLGIDPDATEALINLGFVLNQQGRWAEGSVCSRRAMLRREQDSGRDLGESARSAPVDPNTANRHALPSDLIKSGNQALARGELRTAATCYRNALQQDPQATDAGVNLGYVLGELGDDEATESVLLNVLARQPDTVDALYLLALVDTRRERWSAASERLRRALQLRPNFAEAHNQLGIVLRKQDDAKTACASFLAAIAAQPSMAAAHVNVAMTLRDLGDMPAARQHMREAVAQAPDDLQLRSRLLFWLSHDTGCTPAQYLSEACEWGDQVCACAGALHPTAPPSDEEPLRVGLVSGDLWNHPVGFFLENAISHLNPERVMLFAYSTKRHEDDLGLRLKRRMTQWRDISAMTDAKAAQCIKDDRLHLLLDLSGHTADNRLPVFAWKPAPVQATWLGYFASTGLGTIDYILADPVSIPESLHAHFREHVWHLPDTRLCFSPPGPEDQFPVSPLPALHRGYVTFGSFQSMTKLHRPVLDLWAQVLQAIPGARLRLQNEALDKDGGRQRICDWLKANGIDPQRVSFAGLQPRDKYLLAHAEVDILLDTFPYPGGTTTCEALWMGVPTITLTGDSMLSRQGHSLLHCAGLDDWVATDPAEYVRRATHHANDLPALAMLRARLRQQVLASPLFDGPRFARQLAEVFHGMWAAHARTTH